MPGFGGAGETEQGATGEGFGDFLAAMFYFGTGNAAYEASARKYCVGEWDAVSYNPVTANPGSGCLRWVNGRDESSGADIGDYPGTPSEVHNDGRYWTAAMTCIFEGMGGNLQARNDVLKLIIDSHERLSADSSNQGFERQIASMQVADQNLLGGTHQSLISSCAADRNLITARGGADDHLDESTERREQEQPEGDRDGPGDRKPDERQALQERDLHGPAATREPSPRSRAPGSPINVPDNSTTALSAKASGGGGDSGCSNTINYVEVTPGSSPAAPTITVDEPAERREREQPEGDRDRHRRRGARPSVKLYKNATCTGAPAATETVADVHGHGDHRSTSPTTRRRR